MRLARFLAVLGAAACVACGGSNAPKVETVPAPAPQPVVESAPPAPIGTARVTAGGLNVRRDPATTADVVAQAHKGDRVTILVSAGSWSRVQLADGTTGWVASRLIARDDAPAAPKRRRSGCPADADFRFITPPRPSFTEGAQKHGLVAVDVTVDARGVITGTKVVSNSTGDDALAAVAVAEIKGATFSPPIRNCVAKAFIYTYKRSF